MFFRIGKTSTEVIVNDTKLCQWRALTQITATSDVSKDDHHLFWGANKRVLGCLRGDTIGDRENRVTSGTEEMMSAERVQANFASQSQVLEMIVAL